MNVQSQPLGTKFLKTISGANPVHVFYNDEHIYLQTVNAAGVQISLETRKRKPELISGLLRRAA